MINLYKELIIEHGINPRNKRIIKNYTHSIKAINYLCGDEFILYLNIKDKIIDDISFDGKGCSISIASASIMTILSKKKHINAALERFNYFINLIKRDELNELNELNELKILSNIKNYPSRIKCGTLIWHALENLLKKND